MSHAAALLSHVVAAVLQHREFETSYAINRPIGNKFALTRVSEETALLVQAVFLNGMQPEDATFWPTCTMLLPAAGKTGVIYVGASTLPAVKVTGFEPVSVTDPSADVWEVRDALVGAHTFPHANANYVMVEVSLLTRMDSVLESGSRLFLTVSPKLVLPE